MNKDVQNEEMESLKNGGLSLKSTKEKINFLMMNYDKEKSFNDLTSQKKDKKMDEEIVSLVEEEKMRFKSPRNLSVNLSQNSKKSATKVYKKEEHYLKRVLLSKTSSPCPSLKTTSNLSSQSRPKKQYKKPKHPIFKSPYAKPQFLALKRNASLSSIQSDISSQPSLNDSFTSISKAMGKYLNTNQILMIKTEEKERNGDLPGLRKRVCRKVYSILNKEFKKPKTLSKKLTLALEYRINLLFYYQNPSYIKTVKTLFKKLRVNFYFIFLETRYQGGRIDINSSKKS